MNVFRKFQIVFCPRQLFWSFCTCHSQLLWLSHPVVHKCFSYIIWLSRPQVLTCSLHLRQENSKSLDYHFPDEKMWPRLSIFIFVPFLASFIESSSLKNLVEETKGLDVGVGGDHKKEQLASSFCQNGNSTSLDGTFASTVQVFCDIV